MAYGALCVMRDGSARSCDWLIAYRCTSHAMREDEGSDVRDRAMVDCLSRALCVMRDGSDVQDRAMVDCLSLYVARYA